MNAPLRIAGLVCCLVAPDTMRAQMANQAKLRIDSVTVSSAALRAVLTNLTMCRAASTTGQLWKRSVTMVQAGKAALLASGHVAVLDEDLGQIRIIDRDGVETGRVGGKGKGPGESA